MEYVPAKTIVTKTKFNGWFGMDYNMNIYRGCCHGCIYCDSRSDCYHIDDFDTVKAKENALLIIRDDLRRKVKTGVVGTGAMSDPYNPFLLFSSGILCLRGTFAKGFYSMHLNALYDLQKHTYTDALIPPVHRKDEFRAFVIGKPYILICLSTTI